MKRGGGLGEEGLEALRGRWPGRFRNIESRLGLANLNSIMEFYVFLYISTFALRFQRVFYFHFSGKKFVTCYRRVFAPNPKS